MKRVAELGEEYKHLEWLKNMGLWETSFFVEIYYADQGLIETSCTMYDQYYDFWRARTINWWDNMDEWNKVANQIHKMTKRHRLI